MKIIQEMYPNPCQNNKNKGAFLKLWIVVIK